MASETANETTDDTTKIEESDKKEIEIPDEVTILKLNERQLKASKSITKFLASNSPNFLLLGPGGSGKTTTIVNAFNDSKLSVAFCAFTNKATQVLRTIASKFNIKFKADFMTIHQLLELEIQFLGTEHEIRFKFDREKCIKLALFDVVIFDECSTISKDLYGFLIQARSYIEFKYHKKLHYIFLGDFWQLPPVNEMSSVVFTRSSEEKWGIKKLETVMRSNNDKIYQINQDLLQVADLFRKKDKDALKSFVKKYPRNLVSEKKLYVSNTEDFVQKYLAAWKSIQDTVMLTYSRNNCKKINHYVQDLLDRDADRNVPPERLQLRTFYEGDRCCVDKPIEVLKIKQTNRSGKTIYSLDNASTGEMLYNGEIFDIMEVQNVLVSTPLNSLSYIDSYFEGQILTVRRINCTEAHDIKIIHVDPVPFEAARYKARSKISRIPYIELMTRYVRYFPKLEYGYAITVYKSQGSEWHTVLVNCNSIKWSLIGKGYKAKFSKMKNLFRTTYTAVSRASNELVMYWF